MLLKVLRFLLFLNMNVLAVDSALDCSTAGQTRTMQLSRAHILRTWQPDGAHCRWWESRQSETNRFPAAVRSGPRWLVMQLRQPLMLEAVSVRGWDGEWQEANTNKSLLIVQTVSRLPLELQLEDPCLPSWERFNSSGGWSPLKLMTRNWTQFFFIESLQALSWSSLNFTGCFPNLTLDSDAQAESLLQLKEANNVILKLKYEGSDAANVACSVKNLIGSDREYSTGITKLKTNDSFTRKFEISIAPRLHWHGSTLICCYGDSICPVVRTIGVMFIAKRTKLEMPNEWPLGTNVTIKFTSTEEYPVSDHTCVLEAGSFSEMPLKNVSKTVSLEKSRRGLPAYTTVSEFQVAAEKSMDLRTVTCRSTMSWSIATLYRVSQVHIVEPCTGNVNLGSKSYWRVNDLEEIRFNSPNCSTDNHSCELVFNKKSWKQKLTKIRAMGSTSVHELKVEQQMGQDTDWYIGCRVNQSGLHSNMIKSSSTNPVVFYQGNLTVKSVKLDSKYPRILNWNVNVEDGRPQISNVSCSLTGARQMTSKSNSIYSFTAEICVRCIGFQFNNREQIFRHHEEKCFGDDLSGDGQNCELLRILLFGTIVCCLTSLASVIACAWVLVRRAVSKKCPHVLYKNGRTNGVNREIVALQQRQNATLRKTAAQPVKAFSYYEDPDAYAYSQIGSCLSSPYVNEDRDCKYVN